MLIEDEDFIRDLYKRQLELAGMPTDAFGLGNEGLNAAHQAPSEYELVLLDIMLPDTNGLQILKDLKQNNATKPIPVILLTNLSQDMLIKEGFELGAEGYLVKAAYTPAQIVQEVKNILAKKGSTAPANPAPTPIATPAVTQNTNQPLNPNQVVTPSSSPPPSMPSAIPMPDPPAAQAAPPAPAPSAIPMPETPSSTPAPAETTESSVSSAPSDPQKQ